MAGYSFEEGEAFTGSPAYILYQLGLSFTWPTISGQQCEGHVPGQGGLPSRTRASWDQLTEHAWELGIFAYIHTADWHRTGVLNTYSKAY